MNIFWIAVLSISGLLLTYILLLVISSLFVDPKKEYDKNSRYFRILLVSATYIGLKIMRVKMHYTGKEKLPSGERFLLVCNHRSKFDPLIKWYLMRKYDLAFISKPSNFKVPVFGRFIRKCCFMAIDRENAKKSIQTVNKAASLIKNDEVSIAVYPEGTRNYEKGLLEFHNGIFMIASKSDSDIVVVCMRGTEKIAKNFPFHKTDVYIDILEVIPKEYVKSHRSNEIGEYVKGLLSRKLESENEM